MARFINAIGKEYIPDKFLTYNDVLLQPQYSRIESRKDPSTKTKIGSIELDIPIIASPMDTVCEGEMSIALDKLGGLGIMHRFIKDYDHAFKEGQIVGSCKCVAMAVGYDLDAAKAVSQIFTAHKKPTLICVDLAHGDLEKCLETIETIREVNTKVNIMSGSICTPDAAERSIDAGANILRVGVGGGSMCTTRIRTGHGASNLTAIMQIKERLFKNGLDASIVADGGITNSGDIIKALAAGADAVMLGRLLAGTDESPGELLNVGCDHYVKRYRGMASKEFMDTINKTDVTPEGESTEIEYKGSVVHVINELMGGLRSGMSYSGAKDIVDLQKKAIFTEISYHSYIEGTPHGKL